MSLYVRTVISSRCKCILVQVGPLIYSSKCNFINLPLISLSAHCVSLSQEKRGAEMSDSTHELLLKFFSQQGITKKRKRGFKFKCEMEKQCGLC